MACRGWVNVERGALQHGDHLRVGSELREAPSV